mmetsp:Transcript_56170/g.162760  ORF Transcript_56170/g.162760 Transcript_56170/m.162760 type:complete len:254 (+) Transcript_56170:1223-1984(+)
MPNKCPAGAVCGTPSRPGRASRTCSPATASFAIAPGASGSTGCSRNSKTCTDPPPDIRCNMRPMTSRGRRCRDRHLHTRSRPPRARKLPEEPPRNQASSRRRASRRTARRSGRRCTRGILPSGHRNMACPDSRRCPARRPPCSRTRSRRCRPCKKSRPPPRTCSSQTGLRHLPHGSCRARHARPTRRRGGGGGRRTRRGRTTCAATVATPLRRQHNTWPTCQRWPSRRLRRRRPSRRCRWRRYAKSPEQSRAS